VRERTGRVMLMFRRNRREREIKREVERWISDGTWPRQLLLEVRGKNGFPADDASLTAEQIGELEQLIRTVLTEYVQDLNQAATNGDGGPPPIAWRAEPDARGRADG